MAAGLSQAETAAYASEFGAAPPDPMSEDEANVSPYEDDGSVIPRKRFRGLAGSSRDLRSEVHATKRKRPQDVTIRRECRPRTMRPRELRPLRSDCSVELEAAPAPLGESLRSRLVASWLVRSHTRHLDDVGLSHWRSGQALAGSNRSEHSPDSSGCSDILPDEPS